MLATAVLVTIAMFQTLALAWRRLAPVDAARSAVEVQRVVHFGLARASSRRAIALDLEVDLFAEDRNGARRLDADADLLAHDREDRDLDVVTDHDALV